MRSALYVTLLASLLAIPSLGHAQSTAEVPLSETIQTEQGSIQFFGLSSWSPDPLVDTLKTMAPRGRYLAACATLMERKLGFPDVAPFAWQDSSGTRNYVIAVTGPEHEEHVQFRSFSDNGTPKTEWFNALGADTSTVRKIYPPLMFTVNNYGSALRGHPDSTRRQVLQHPRARFDSATVDRALSFLQSHQSEADRKEALQVLAGNGNKWNRTLAVAILANFPSSPEVWHELTRALRDPWDPVSNLARFSLENFAAHKPEVADWEPVLPSLRAVLSGTNYILAPSVLDVLTRTKIDSKHSAELLGGRSGQVLLAHLRTGEPRTSPKIRAFLRHLSGQKGLSDWSEWIHELNQSG